MRRERPRCKDTKRGAGLRRCYRSKKANRRPRVRQGLWGDASFAEARAARGLAGRLIDRRLFLRRGLSGLPAWPWRCP